jgi:flagellar protein FliS
MNTAKARSAYQKSEAQAQVHPVKLIHLLYERVLVHLQLAEQGMAANDAKARGENLGKAIAIISELNASIKDEDSSEAAGFLRGLYSAILMELPKVGISLDAAIVQQAYRYIDRLREIWESTAMVEAGLSVDHHEPAPETPPAPKEESGVAQVCSKYGMNGPRKFKAMDAAACYLHGVSVSI